MSSRFIFSASTFYNCRNSFRQCTFNPFFTRRLFSFFLMLIYRCLLFYIKAGHDVVVIEFLLFKNVNLIFKSRDFYMRPRICYWFRSLWEKHTYFQSIVLLWKFQNRTARCIFFFTGCLSLFLFFTCRLIKIPKWEGRRRRRRGFKSW